MQWFLKYCKALREKIVTERFLKYCKVLLAVILNIAVLLGLYFVYLGWNWISGNHEAVRTVGLGVVAVIGLYFAYRRITTADKQAEIAMKNHLADAYTRAIDQLGKKEEAVQLGGLYALEKIADSNESYYRQIIEVLCAFIRLIAGPADKIPPAPSEEKVKSTVQTALTILGRRNLDFGKLPQNSDIEIDLAGIKLCNANLSGANLSGVNLRVNLREADLSEANLFEADLSEANLVDANLSGAELLQANLERANLLKADLSGADLSWANLSRAIFCEANLEGAMLIEAKVTLEQLQAAKVDMNTILPDHIDPKSLDLKDPLI